MLSGNSAFGRYNGKAGYGAHTCAVGLQLILGTRLTGRLNLTVTESLMMGKTRLFLIFLFFFFPVSSVGPDASV